MPWLFPPRAGRTSALFATLLAATATTTPTATAQVRLFRADATNGVVTISESDPAVLDLIDRTLRREGEFAALAGTDFDASFTFLGVPNSIRVDLNAAGTAAILSLPGINFNRAFTGTDERDVRAQIRRFLKKDGADIIARLRKRTRRLSSASVTDGNPDANTATAARSVFFTHGLSDPGTLSFPGAGPAETPRRVSAAVTTRTADLKIAGEHYRANQFRLNAELLSLRLGEMARLEMPVHADYVEIAGTEIFGAGAYLALPVQWRRMDEHNALGFRLTPVGGAQLRASFDAVSGAVVAFGGMVSSLDLRVAPALVVSLINQATYHQALPINVDGFAFENDIEQIILKNGLRLVTPLGKRGHLSGYYVNTRFLEDAAIDQYHTVGAGLESRLGRRQTLALLIESDLAHDYASAAFRLEWNRLW